MGVSHTGVQSVEFGELYTRWVKPWEPGYNPLRPYEISRPFVFTVHFAHGISKTYAVPTGFGSDGPSYPRLVYPLVGLFLPLARQVMWAAVAHDYLIRTNALPDWLADKVYYKGQKASHNGKVAGYVGVTIGSVVRLLERVVGHHGWVRTRRGDWAG